ncbi:uracil-DNA glycosylase family protein [Inquilinus limosus]|uniref:Uracil-DNA glycosylase n=1 Tax=Inquilinus limosus TaxID=171674 RepID=A0A211ZJ82_9PROT|nr:uracil-DNA glycosylase family protein [Inquilinus limosus]OWJ65348.1 uracil-DNA glycosylase [Inquilinus limosus]
MAVAAATDELAAVVAAARACRICAGRWPHPPRPVLRAAATARLLIIGQAPGARVQASGLSWTDASGDRLRQWLGVDPDAFYDEGRVALVSMGLCFPGTDPKGGDYPPPRICADTWHPRLRPLLSEVRLTLLVGGLAQARYLGARRKASVAETVANWRDYLPDFIPLPHPSWRNTGWLKRNPWFEADLLPVLRARAAAALADAA